MVLGSILNWVVGRTLDFTLDSAIWITKKTGNGLLYTGYYLINYRKQQNNNEIQNENNNQNQNQNENNIEMKELLNLTKEELHLLREENQNLKNEIINIKNIITEQKL